MKTLGFLGKKFEFTLTQWKSCETFKNASGHIVKFTWRWCAQGKYYTQCFKWDSIWIFISAGKWLHIQKERGDRALLIFYQRARCWWKFWKFLHWFTRIGEIVQFGTVWNCYELKSYWEYQIKMCRQANWGKPTHWIK